MASNPGVGSPQSESLTIRETSVEFLTNQASSLSENDIRVLTNNWISAQGDPVEQLNGLRDLFKKAGDHSEVMNKFITEAWNVLLDREVWKANYSSLKKALAVIDTPLLRELRLKAGNNRKRKANYVEIIGHSWGERRRWLGCQQFWEDLFGRAGVHFKKIHTRTGDHHGDTDNNDSPMRDQEWSGLNSPSDHKRLADLDKLPNESALALLTEARPSSKELTKLETNSSRLILPKRGVPDEAVSSRKRRRCGKRSRKNHVDIKEDVETSDDEKDNDNQDDSSKEVKTPKGEQEETSSVKLLTSRRSRFNCKCQHVSIAVLERVCRKFSVAPGMNSPTECIDT